MQTTNKLQKIFFGLAVLVLGLAGIWLLSSSNSTAKPSESARSYSNGVLSAEVADYDFGKISMAAGKVTHEYAVKNMGTDPVRISKMFTSCMCTVASITTKNGTWGPFGMQGHGYIPSINVDIAPGEEAVVSATFDPAAHGPAGVGKIERVVVLEQEGGRKPLELNFSAMVTP